jgi:hypothetical protein
VRGDSSSPRYFGIFGSTRCTLIRPNGGKNRPHFRTPSANPLTNAPEMGYNRVMNFAPTPLPQGGKGKGSGEDATSRNQAQGGENTKSVRRRRIPLTPTLSPLPQGGRGKKGVGGSIQKQVVTHDGKGTMRHRREGAGRRTDVLVSQVRGVVLPRPYLRRLVGQQTPLPQKARNPQRAGIDYLRLCSQEVQRWKERKFG